MKSILLMTKGHFRPYLSEAMPNYPRIKSNRTQKVAGRWFTKDNWTYGSEHCRKRVVSPDLDTHAYEKLYSKPEWCPKWFGTEPSQNPRLVARQSERLWRNRRRPKTRQRRQQERIAIAASSTAGQVWWGLVLWSSAVWGWKVEWTGNCRYSCALAVRLHLEAHGPSWPLRIWVCSWINNTVGAWDWARGLKIKIHRGRNERDDRMRGNAVLCMSSSRFIGRRTIGTLCVTRTGRKERTCDHVFWRAYPSPIELCRRWMLPWV